MGWISQGIFFCLASIIVGTNAAPVQDHKLQKRDEVCCQPLGDPCDMSLPMCTPCPLLPMCTKPNACKPLPICTVRFLPICTPCGMVNKPGKRWDEGGDNPAAKRAEETKKKEEEKRKKDEERRRHEEKEKEKERKKAEEKKASESKKKADDFEDMFEIVTKKGDEAAKQDKKKHDDKKNKDKKEKERKEKEKEKKEKEKAKKKEQEEQQQKEEERKEEPQQDQQQPAENEVEKRDHGHHHGADVMEDSVFEPFKKKRNAKGNKRNAGKGKKQKRSAYPLELMSYNKRMSEAKRQKRGLRPVVF